MRNDLVMDNFSEKCRGVHILDVCKVYNISTRSPLELTTESIASSSVICQPERITLAPPTLTTGSGVFQDGMPLCEGTSHNPCARSNVPFRNAQICPIATHELHFMHPN